MERLGSLTDDGMAKLGKGLLRPSPATLMSATFWGVGHSCPELPKLAGRFFKPEVGAGDDESQEEQWMDGRQGPLEVDWRAVGLLRSEV